MRGKVWVHQSSPPVIRITPAYAGKRQNFDFLFFQCKDHPRLCGEKLACQFLFDTNLGSPPPMRGKDGRFSRRYLKLGITPAYAGKSAGPDKSHNQPRDHPRLCGEKLTL